MASTGTCPAHPPAPSPATSYVASRRGAVRPTLYSGVRHERDRVVRAVRHEPHQVGWVFGMNLVDELRAFDARAEPPGPDEVYETFATWAAKRGLPLYPHQEAAMIELVSGANV